MAKPIMIQGTSSGAGKTTIALALCRIFKQDGYCVAPFKSQNMTSNTVVLDGGEEIAISQVLQARAAGIPPDARMNPVVIKPLSGGHGTQIVLNGKPYDVVSSRGVAAVKETLMQEILKAYESLAAQYEIIVIEGAGSPVELNLNKNDIVNMGVALSIGAPVLLVSDIDRGGVFASLFGTMALFNEQERSCVKATIVNRFKGDLEYFADGVGIIESITGVPVAGVVPYFRVDLPEEDGLLDGDGTAADVRGTGGTGTDGADTGEFSSSSNSAEYEEQFNLIAHTVRASLNMDLIYSLIK
ncbi:MAG: cobyric acid synthase [Oscillospiraceae bacterium]|nr:cobyric acid synthase [Oscillospiraceae bacterium]